MTGRSTPRPRKNYRHGDLARVLLAAGVALARTAGPEAVLLREVTRQAGVAPNAAYRHFANRDALLDAVRDVALSRAARSMETHLALLGPERRTAAYARGTLLAVGLGYLAFARTERGLFRTAFSGHFERSETVRPARRGESGLNPFELLCAALDRMARSGILSASRRAGAEYLAWSAVHGMAMLYIEGPLQGLTPLQFEHLADRLVNMVEAGLTSDAPRVRQAAKSNI